MKLSVIIPVYRADATLKRCVESVLSQGCESMEVILVDDGSPDDCPRQCDDWAQRDARIRTIHKANGGLSDARNAGLEIATGDYLTFVDADDYLAPNTYQQLMKQLCESPETDLLEYPAYIRYGASDQHRLTFRRNIPPISVTVPPTSTGSPSGDRPSTMPLNTGMPHRPTNIATPVISSTAPVSSTVYVSPWAGCSKTLSHYPSCSRKPDVSAPRTQDSTTICPTLRESR